jgi:hypothetical protein
METKFIHYSTHNKSINKNNFIKPDFNIPDRYRSTLNPPLHTLYLSIENKEGTSNWYERCKKVNDEIFLSGTKTTLSIDLNKHNIYVFKNTNDLKIFFEKYGIFQKKPLEKFREDNEKKIMNDIIILLYYLDNISKSKKELIKNEEYIIEQSKLREYFALPEIDYKEIKDIENISIPNNKIFTKNKKIPHDLNFIIDVFRLLKIKYDLLEYYSNKNFYYLNLEKIDYLQIKNDGWNGIYYSTELYDNINSLNISFSNKFYKKYNILKYDILKYNTSIYKSHLYSNKCTDDEIISYIKWLETDTLMLFNIDFM